MRVTALIPARGGSKGVPLKNIEPVGGVPLITRAISACASSQSIGEIVVSTDHDAIAQTARNAGAHVLQRPTTLSGDTVSSEAVLLHALDSLEEMDGSVPDVTVFVQCTSPFIDPEDLDQAVSTVVEGRADSVFSAIETHSFLWRHTPEGARGVNHDHTHRPRRQDREPHFQETGAFYVMRTQGLRAHRHRFFGRITFQEVSPQHGFEVDTPDDLRVVRALAPVTTAPESLDVDAVVTDFDGVHTDDRATVSENGGEAVSVSRSDGMGIRLLREDGVRTLILSTEENPVVCARADKLKTPVLHGLSDKQAALATWLAEENLDSTRVAYVGNDVNDLGCMSLVGWPVAVPEAHPEVLAIARVVLTRKGGDGAVRELCERVLKARKGPQ